MSYRLRKWTLATVLIAVIVFGLSGRVFDPWLWAFVAMWSALLLYACAR